MGSDGCGGWGGEKATVKRTRGAESEESETVDRGNKGRRQIVFRGSAAVLAIKHEGDYSAGEFA